MVARLLIVLVASAVLNRQANAQQFPQGYLDPTPVLQAARAAIGTDNLRCVTISGNGTSYAVGQARMNGFNIDWPRIEALTNYTRTFTWGARTLKEQFDRKRP